MPERAIQRLMREAAQFEEAMSKLAYALNVPTAEATKAFRAWIVTVPLSWRDGWRYVMAHPEELDDG